MSRKKQERHDRAYGEIGHPAIMPEGTQRAFRESDHYPHTEDGIVNEMLRLTEGPNVPSFVPDFQYTMARSFSRRGTLTPKQVKVLLDIHRLLVMQGYLTCGQCFAEGIGVCEDF